MNIILAVAVLTGLFMVRFPKIPSTPSPEIGYIVPDSAAAKAGLHEGDRIVQIGDTRQPDLGRHLHERSGQRRPSSERLDRSQWRAQAGYRDAGARSQNRRRIRGLGRAERNRNRQRCSRIRLPPRPDFKPGDIMVSVDGQPIHSTPKVHDIINSNGGKPVDVVFSRNGKLMTAHLTPAMSENNGTQGVADRREAAAESRARQLAVPAGAGRIRPRERQERHLHLSVPARHRRAAHVAEVAGRGPSASCRFRAKKLARAPSPISG